MPRRTTLILGAGASYGYGFPLGSDLRRELIALGNNAAGVEHLLLHGIGTIRAFSEAFEGSQVYSIDSFLAHRPQFVGIGKRAIAHLIAKAEAESKLSAAHNKDHWYQYLFNQLAAGPWATFDPSWLSIVSFNYDRSLETYLVRALGHRYGISTAEVVGKLKSMAVVHVYGALGSPWEGERGYMPYGYSGSSFADYIHDASERIQVIEEGRNDEETVRTARQLILQAERVGVLGFGFDPVNVDRLGGRETFKSATGIKPVDATIRGLTKAEATKAAGQLWGRPDMAAVLVHTFYDYGCLELLRHTLILD
jgi:hypothetical protein